ncbi:MAG: hypothetical protein P8I93_05635 [Crocinitomicaceae bacterium]|nr:hypothetical protein [Crocinitomicaceae bacterium]
MLNFSLKFSLFLISNLISFYASNCSGGYYINYDCLFNKEIIYPDNKEGMYNLWEYNPQNYKYASNSKTSNLNEWSDFLENVYQTQTLNKLIYINRKQLKKIAKEKTLFDLLFELRASAKTNSKYVNIRKKESEFCKYMLLAYEIELHLYNYIESEWRYNRREKRQKDPKKHQLLLKKTQKIIDKTKYDFIRERAIYQLIKLHRYTNNNEEIISIYEDKFPQTSSMISYWAMGHYAAALRKTGKYAEANYFFTLIYVNCPSRRKSAYLSISINSEEEFEQLKELCKFQDEKVLIHFARGMNPKNLGANDLNNILSINPKHELAKVMMSHEINRMENAFLKLNGDKPLQMKSYLSELIEINKKYLKYDDKTNFWSLSLAYLHFLNNNSSECDQVLSNINPDIKDSKKLHQIIFLVNYINGHPSLTNEEQNMLGDILYEINENKIRYPFLDKKHTNEYYPYADLDNTINRYVFEKMKEKEINNSFLNKIFSGERISYDLYQKEITLKELDLLILDFSKSKKNRLIDYAIEYYFDTDRNKYIKQYNVNLYDFARASLLEYKGTLQMRNPITIKSAIQTFKQIPVFFQDRMTTFKLRSANPFSLQLKRHWKEYEQNQFSYCSTKLDLAILINNIYKRAIKTKGAMDYYKIGLAYYNMSYYGKSWNMLSYFKSNWPGGFHDNKIALSFFEKALKTSSKQKTLSKEKRATITFMKANCELNIFSEMNDNYIPKMSNRNNYYYSSGKITTFRDFMSQMEIKGFQTAYESLKNKYSNTLFYRDIINECAYFNYYVHK